MINHYGQPFIMQPFSHFWTNTFQVEFSGNHIPCGMLECDLDCGKKKKNTKQQNMINKVVH